MVDTAPFEQRLELQAQRLRAGGGLGRSDALTRLFDFLVAQTLAGRTPKEVEIAQDVFDKHGSFDVMLDASVRVYIHRLRRKIEDFYTANPGGGDRLFIPKGEYRLAIAANDAAEGADSDLVKPAVAVSRRRAWPGSRAAILAVALVLAANLVAWIMFVRPSRSDPVVQAVASDFWKPLADNGRPTVLATGDYYIFGEAHDSIEVARLVREFSINSKSDLDQYLMAHPADIGRYVDMGLHYLPTSIPAALRNLLPIIARATGGGSGQELLIPMSQMTPDMLKKANIVYVGYLSGLGLLRDPVFSASGFQIGSSYDELIDRRTGKHYVSDQGEVVGRRRPRRDFAYIASLPGPSGTRVLIVGGTRDAAVLQAGEIASDRRQLDRITARTGTSQGFEALYQVQTLDDLNLGSTLILARGLRTEKLWDLDQMRQRGFPDQIAPTP